MCVPNYIILLSDGQGALRCLPVMRSGPAPRGGHSIQQCISVAERFGGGGGGICESRFAGTPQWSAASSSVSARSVLAWCTVVSLDARDVTGDVPVAVIRTHVAFQPTVGRVITIQH